MYTLTAEEKITDLLFVSAYKLLALSQVEGAVDRASLIIRKDPKGCSAKDELTRVKLPKRATKIAECLLGRAVLCCGDSAIQVDLNQ